MKPFFTERILSTLHGGMFLFMFSPQYSDKKIMILLLAAFIDLIFNIPFGYWRANTRRFSVQWFLSIHLPIPFIILLRIFSGIGFEFITYPIMVSAFILGQYLGYKYHQWRKENNQSPLSSCLILDMVKVERKTVNSEQES